MGVEKAQKTGFYKILIRFLAITKNCWTDCRTNKTRTTYPDICLNFEYSHYI